jgi:hypothetical protein
MVDRDEKHMLALRHRARKQILRTGAPETALLAAEAFGPCDWLPLARAMDRMFIVGVGHLTQRRFWFTRDHRLDGMSPIEALRTPDGPQRVCDLAAAWRPRRTRTFL